MLCNVLDRTLMLALLLFLWHRHHRHSNTDSHVSFVLTLSPINMKVALFFLEVGPGAPEHLGQSPYYWATSSNFTGSSGTTLPCAFFISYTYYILCFVYGCIFLSTHTCVCGGQRTTFLSQPSPSTRGCGIQDVKLWQLTLSVMSHLAGPLLLNTEAVFFSLMPSPLETEFINFSERLHWFHNFPCICWKVFYYALPGNI